MPHRRIGPSHATVSYPSCHLSKISIARPLPAHGATGDDQTPFRIGEVMDASRGFPAHNLDLQGAVH